MSFILDLENPANWQTRDSQSLSAPLEGLLPEYLSKVSFSSSLIAILVDNAEAKDTWTFAGYFAKKINLPFGPPSALSIVDIRRLWLKQKQLLILPKITNSYQVLIRFPKYFTQASVTVWEYQGLDDTEQLTQINSKLDALLQQHPP